MKRPSVRRAVLSPAIAAWNWAGVMRQACSQIASTAGPSVSGPGVRPVRLAYSAMRASKPKNQISIICRSSASPSNCGVASST